MARSPVAGQLPAGRVVVVVVEGGTLLGLVPGGVWAPWFDCLQPAGLAGRAARVEAGTVGAEDGGARRGVGEADLLASEDAAPELSRTRHVPGGEWCGGDWEDDPPPVADVALPGLVVVAGAVPSSAVACRVGVVVEGPVEGVPDPDGAVAFPVCAEPDEGCDPPADPVGDVPDVPVPGWSACVVVAVPAGWTAVAAVVGDADGVPVPAGGALGSDGSGGAGGGLGLVLPEVDEGDEGADAPPTVGDEVWACVWLVPTREAVVVTPGQIVAVEDVDVCAAHCVVNTQLVDV